MLKKMSKLFLGLIVIAGSACVTPTHASSAFGVVLVYIQAAGDGGAKDEMVSIYNNSPSTVDITNWCFTNKSNVAFACFDVDIDELGETDGASDRYYLPAYSYAVVATSNFVISHALPAEISENYISYEPTDERSGSIVNSSDTILLVDNDNQIIDSYSWSSQIPSGKVASRHKSLSNPLVYETSDLLVNWSNEKLVNAPTSQVQLLSSPPEELPSETPIIHPQITELLPNPEGSDVGNEFIKLYNPSSNAINLSDYTLRVGPNLEKTYHFPDGAKIQPNDYLTFYNNQIKFTLANSSSSVQLAYQGQLVGKAITYLQPPSGRSWVVVDGVWQYTNEITTTNTSASTNVPKPCAANQYRNPATNRCKLLTSTSTGGLKPCAANQERNPETNRCRNIVKMTNADYAVKGVSTERSPTNWYTLLAIGGVVVLILAYAVWEWREELRQLLSVLKKKFARN